MAEGPRVCVVAPGHPALSRGRAEAAAHRHFLALREAGWAARFIAAAEQPLARRAHPILRAHAPGEQLYDTLGMAEDRLAWTDPDRRAALLEALLRQEAEVYHFHHCWRVGADLIAALRRARPAARLVITLHDMRAICLNQGRMIRTGGRELCEEATLPGCQACFPDRTAAWLLARKALLLEALRGLDAALYPSDFLRARHAAWGLATVPAFVIAEPPPRRADAAPRRAPPALGREARFAVFADATPLGGLDVLLPAFSLALAQRPGLALTVHGMTAEAVSGAFPGLRVYIASLGPALSFTGPHAEDEVPGLLEQAGWVVMPSLGWDACPRMIQEARRAGTPLLASDIGVLAEQVRPGRDGLHFRCGSVPDLTRTLVKAADASLHASLCATLADADGPGAFLGPLRAAYGLAEATHG